MSAQSWSIEVDPQDVPEHVRKEHQRVVRDSEGSDWDVRLVDVNADIDTRKTASYFSVAVRRSPRKTGKSLMKTGENMAVVSETTATDLSNKGGETAGQTIRTFSGHSPLWEEQNGRTAEGPCGHRVPRAEDRAESRSDEAPCIGSAVDFGSLPTVKSMGTNKTTHVIGFDTEFTYDDNDHPTKRVIDSYQFACTDPLDESVMVETVVLPLEDERIYFEDALYIVNLAAGLHVLARGGVINPRGVLVRDVRRAGKKSSFDYKATRDEVFKNTIRIILGCHYGNADLTAFRRPPFQRAGGDKFNDVLRRVTSASGGLVSLMPSRFMRRSGHGSNSYRWLPFTVTVRDTMGQAAPGHKGLDKLGDSCGVPKLEVGDSIKNMRILRREDLLKFLDYGVNDSVIVVEYLAMLWGLNGVPPVTLSGAGASAVRDGVMRYLNIGTSADFLMRFRGLYKKSRPEAFDDNDQLAYYATRELAPVDGDANQSHTAWKRAFHGGWNACLAPGLHPYPTYDHDIQSAYPSAMASIIDVDYVGGCIDEVVKDRELTFDDFPLGPITPLVAYVEWEFPEGTVAPCLPVVEGDSVIYPRTAEESGAGQGDDIDHYEGFSGAWCAGPELYLALKLGARVTAQIGYRMKLLDVADGEPSMSLRSALKQMVEDRAVAKKTFGKKSLEEQTIKVATNSVYGKLAQDVSERNGWDSWEQEMASIGGSSVTSPYHASMTTSLVRSLLLAMANSISILSVTTDGFITAEKDIEDYDCFGIADVFRDAREALTGDRTVWEVKHHQDDLLNLSTRGNVSLLEHGVFAKAGLKTPEGIVLGSMDERKWFWDTVVAREGKIPNPYTAFPSFRELSRTDDRLDFIPTKRVPEVSSVDFDLKRMPVEGSLRVDTVSGHEVAGFETAPWESVRDYRRARSIADHMQLYRFDTTGDDRPSGCLRTAKEWETWFKRFGSAVGRRIYSADSAMVTELVAAHKEGLVVVRRLAAKGPVADKLEWLSSLVGREFTRAQWDHMSKRNRRQRVLDDADLDEIRALVDELNQEDGNE